MADKYLKRDATSGQIQEVEATDVSAGAGDAGEVVALNSNGLIDASMLANANVMITATAGVNLAAGDLVYIDSSGEVQLATAGAMAPFAACGFVLAAVTATNPADVFFEGIIPGFMGLTVGGRVYLDTTAGGITQTPLTGSGELHQYVGKALSASTVLFEPDDAILLA